MLYEHDVIDAVADYLQSRGWVILRKAAATDRGTDVIAEKEGRQLWIEAKGETSSRRGSRRFGKPFNSAQVFDHVAKAFYVAVRHSESRTGERPVRGAMALPDTSLNHARVEPIAAALSKLGISVFWVADDRTVREQT